MMEGFFTINCLAVTYFHMQLHTIISAAPFHYSVRDGKKWIQSAMTAKRNQNLTKSKNKRK